MNADDYCELDERVAALYNLEAVPLFSTTWDSCQRIWMTLTSAYALSMSREVLPPVPILGCTQRWYVVIHIWNNTLDETITEAEDSHDGDRITSLCTALCKMALHIAEKEKAMP